QVELRQPELRDLLAEAVEAALEPGVGDLPRRGAVEHALRDGDRVLLADRVADREVERRAREGGLVETAEPRERHEPLLGVRRAAQVLLPARQPGSVRPSRREQRRRRCEVWVDGAG